MPLFSLAGCQLIAAINPNQGSKDYKNTTHHYKTK